MPKSLATTLRERGAAITKRREPLWAGPEDSGPMGGISQSMLGRYPCCAERFRLKYIEGWSLPDRFDHKIEYGQLWHAGEEALASNQDWEKAVLKYAQGLVKKYPHQQDEINKYYQACKVQFPIYVEYWKKQKDVTQRTPLLQEEVFHVPYKLPSGRVVCLRGKFDAVDLIGTGKTAGIWLQENKSKGDVDSEMIKRQLSFDLQTMIYLIALQEKLSTPPGLGDLRASQIRGVRYNVVKRPFSGGRGSIKKHQATEGSKCPKCKATGRVVESYYKVGISQNMITGFCPKCGGRGRIGGKPDETDESYYGRLRDIIKDDTFDESGKPKEDNEWFKRWKVEISQADIDKFKHQFLDPILENLCNQYDWWKMAYQKGWDVFDSNKMGDECPLLLHHYRLPFGVYNSVTEQGFTEYDEYLATGNSVGLVQATELFRELQ